MSSGVRLFKGSGVLGFMGASALPGAAGDVGLAG